MDISTLNGFVTGLLIGPETIVPSRWIPEIFGVDSPDGMIWESEADTGRYMGLIFAYNNSLAELFDTQPASYKPLFHFRRVGDRESVSITQWCSGFMTAVELALDSWAPLIEDEEAKELLFPLLLYGTDEGRATLEKKPDFRNMSPQEWFEAIPLMVQKIRRYWLPYRRSMVPVIQQLVDHSVGRNDPCPCGSGKKFKKCCLN